MFLERLRASVRPQAAAGRRPSDGPYPRATGTTDPRPVAPHHRRPSGGSRPRSNDARRATHRRPATKARLAGTVRRVALNISLILLTGGTLVACEEAIEGRVSMVGSEPFTYLAITTGEGRQVALTGEKAEELEHEHQGRQVRVYGDIVREEQGPGQPARLEVSRFEVLEE